MVIEVNCVAAGLHGRGEDSERSGSYTEVDGSIVPSDEETDFDLRLNDFDAAMVHTNGAVEIVVDTREEEPTRPRTSSTYC